MAEDLIPHSEVQEGAAIVPNTTSPVVVENNHVSAPNANANYVTPVTNGTTEIEAKAKNKIASIAVDKSTINPYDIVTYTVKLDKKFPDTLESDLTKVKFSFWLQDKNKKTVSLEVGSGKAAITSHKTNKGAIQIVKKGNLQSEDKTSDFFVLKENQNLTSNIKSSSYYYALILVDKENNQVTLQVKFSKWLDTFKVRTEAYLNGDKIKADGLNTTASRTVKAQPEIIEAYWLNAAGRKIIYAGYNQDAYLYLKTLGLQGQTIEIQVFDADTYPSSNQHVSTETDDKIDWKNNKIKIESREIIKQFKVGNIKRYETAQADEGAEDNIIGLYNFDNKKINDLELYIHIANSKTLKIENIKPKYGKLKLIADEKIIRAFFAKTETERVQADAPEIKTKKGTKLPPKDKVPYYEKLDNGIIGQKIQLVAECANLEGKEVVFKLYEKEPLLVDKDIELPVFQKNNIITEVKATVTNGFAIAEIELKHCKEEVNNEDWTRLLFPNTVKNIKEIKNSNLYIETNFVNEMGSVSKKQSLRNDLFKLTTKTCGCQKCIDYQDVWKSPTINTQSYENKNRFEKVLRYNSSHPNGYYHKGTDILTGSTYKELHSLLCGVVVYTKDSFITNKYASGSLGNIITVKSFDKDGNKIFIMYCHLDKIYVKENDTIIHGQKIGLSGSTGNASDQDEPNGTKNKGIDKEFWHVHIEAATTYGNAATMSGQARKDPELFMKSKFDKDGKSI